MSTVPVTPQASAPTFTPAAGTFASAQTITMSDSTSGASIYYTLDGSTPTTSSSQYASPITLSSTATVNAIASASGYTTSSVTTATFTFTTPTGFITINPANPGVAVTNQILGMNMAYWYDPTTPAIVPAFETAKIKTLRWPGGSGSDIYHWQTNSFSTCEASSSYLASNTAFQDFVASVVTPGSFDASITVNYGSNANCTGGGDPNEAAAWVAEAQTLGANVTHWTVGNEVFGDWEEDLHSAPHDPTTYASEVSTGFYPLMKAANTNAQVGVVVDAGYTTNWDPIVLANAPYDFVEYHYYPQNAGDETDSFLINDAAPGITTYINLIKTELATAGHPNTPIYVGEIGSVNTNPGKQTTSITQALYAGQLLGELMNDGVARATWWIGFGGCSDASSGNFSSSLYGWQNFGGYMVFSDGLPESGCEGAPKIPTGIALPTARAFQLFSNVAQAGENVLTPTLTGNTTDLRAYAATHNGGSVLLLFNLNETASQAVSVTVTGQTQSSAVTVQTYDKALYDQSQTNIWAAPTSTTLGSQSLPLAVVLPPWSMNVITISQ